ncbi:pyridoxal phosphate-dependent aminotransferase [Catellatospora sichuanensis]|uniref:pyridoxal phosphate-dependent aminotransferase n=1 Tax=Catellatospora sichuanensis TaxID=1969805 RepID=UPI00118288E2|nr:pyridoxal phosphate-dependent aminotransferase [Catellatospora sichuanensis]
MSGPAVSDRCRSVVTWTYDSFPVPDGSLDLRGDNSPPLETARLVLAGLNATAEQAAFYGSVAGEQPLREVVGRMLGLSAAQVVITAGGSEALHLALLCAADPGDTVIAPRPGFPGFDQLAVLAGLHVDHYDVPGPIPGVGHGQVRVICSPHNPTGVLVGGQDVRPGGGWTIWDVSHSAPLITSHPAAPAAECDIVVFSLSKLLRLPGIRIGCLASPSAALIKVVEAVKTHMSMSASQLSQQVALGVLTSPTIQAELGARKHQVDRHRLRLQTAVNRSAAFRCVEADAGTHLLVSAEREADAWAMLRAAGIVGLPGVVFGAGQSTVRLCSAQPAAVVDAAAHILEQQ